MKPQIATEAKPPALTIEKTTDSVMTNSLDSKMTRLALEKFPMTVLADEFAVEHGNRIEIGWFYGKDSAR